MRDQNPTLKLQLPKPETADRGTVRLGSANLSADFPTLKRPRPEVSDRGTVRLGSANLSADFPA